MRIAQVLLPLPLAEAFDYEIPDGLEVAVGDHVIVPLGPREVWGVVRGLKDGAGFNRPLKPVLERVEVEPLPVGTLSFVEWAAHWQVAPPGDPLAIALRGLRAEPPRPSRRLFVTGKPTARPTPARERVLEAAVAGAPTAAGLAKVAGVSAGVVKALLDEGVLDIEDVPPSREWPRPDPAHAEAKLSVSQGAAARALNAMIDERAFRVALLDGVTGSGKTEVYLETVAHQLAADPDAQILVLLPEIALTQAVIARFTERFGAEPAEWHSAISSTKRRKVWDAVADGRARIVVGARSALFLPFRTLKLIVIDEEHDGSFKQDDGFIYHARDLAIARARIETASVVLASATPSLETLWNVEQGRYRWLRLAARHGRAEEPEVDLIDLRAHPPEHGHWLSAPLVTALKETIARGEQALLFLNRRGYAPVVICKACGQRMTSPDSDSWLVEHRYTGRLVCHLTGFSMPKPKTCPHCAAADSLVAIGPGVERIEEEVKRLFPEARVEVFSSDTAPDGETARELIARMERGEIDVMVATQAAAKGHNFPMLTLVGVVDADLGLKGGDLRAGERTFQLLAQVAGRAGRAEHPGRALLQTWTPEHPVMQALKARDRDAFVAAESADREASKLPPYGRLVAIIVSSENPTALDGVVRALAAAVPNAEDAEVYGPADAPLSLIRGRRRKRFLVRADRRVDVQGLVSTWLSRVKVPSSVRVVVDVDPYSFL
ncbi:MAG TPA: primosomal protein N' [Caulobacteraceae bacterium]|nr:primosomal protein N' [Caulobacteraceae bacterium]